VVRAADAGSIWTRFHAAASSGRAGSRLPRLTAERVRPWSPHPAVVRSAHGTTTFGAKRNSRSGPSSDEEEQSSRGGSSLPQPRDRERLARQARCPGGGTDSPAGPRRSPPRMSQVAQRHRPRPGNLHGEGPPTLRTADADHGAPGRRGNRPRAEEKASR